MSSRIHAGTVIVRALLLVAAAVFAGCAGTGWPDEPGIPVPVSNAENAQASDLFLEALSARRRETNLAEPMVTPSLQSNIRELAEELQNGKVSAAKALPLAQRWGKAVYRRDVNAWILNCGAGAKMDLPRTLVTRPAVVMSFAAAHFRPRSSSVPQCGVIVVTANGSDEVTEVKLGSLN